MTPGKMNEVLLSLTLAHDSGAALFVDGRLVAAVGEERLNRIKNTRAFPYSAIAECLRLGGVSASDVTQVLLGSRISPNWVALHFEDFHSRESSNLFSPLLYAVVAEQVAFRRTGLIHWEAALVRRLVRRKLERIGIRAPLRMFDHHLSHGYSAYAAAPFDHSLVVSIDAMGDGLSSLASTGDDGVLKPIGELSGFQAPAYIYSQITQLLGFRPGRHEGKITGLAAYGDPEVCGGLMRRLMAFDGEGFRILHTANRHHPLYRDLLTHRREDIAAALQTVFEDVVTAYVAKLLRRSGRRHLALAGGIFANVKLNQRLKEIPGVESIFVYPNMGDGGLSVGAGLAFLSRRPEGLDTLYLGGDIDAADAARALRASGLPFTEPEDIEAEVAALLADGKVVARVAGRMEFGPRALGNRSILFRPDDKTVNDWLNVKLQRTEFMPFAPSTIEERAADYYHRLSGAEETARFMTITFDCTAEGSARQPACVHVDGTARPQIVRRADAPSYHRIIDLFSQKTGIHSVLNTSFNVHEEPIVNGPDDAIKAFRQCGLDALALGPFLAVQLG